MKPCSAEHAPTENDVASVREGLECGQVDRGDVVTIIGPVSRSYDFSVMGNLSMGLLP